MIGKGLAKGLLALGGFLRLTPRRKKRGPKPGASWDEKAVAIFARIDEHVSQRKVYLDEDYTIYMLCEALAMNRSYVSRAINDVYGKNYRHYMNSYRAKYALDLMRKDKRMVLKEVARLSGFGSMGTFNSAFRMEFLITPRELREKMEEGER